MADKDITVLLAKARAGEPEQISAVFEALYPELVRLANSRLRGTEATISPTVLVHELFLRVTQGSPLPVNDRNHFFAASAKAMRWI
ncbi:MAG: RNA polymerase subunit sigma, partial [Gammaproteobacteria bacterium]|nr:RNA polymerase subunit sigma [Gammaproteobacteria bacterium]